MSGFYRALDRLLDQFSRRSNLAEQPIRVSEVGRRGGAVIQTEAELGVAVALWIKYPRRLLEMRSRLHEIALPEAG